MKRAHSIGASVSETSAEPAIEAVTCNGAGNGVSGPAGRHIGIDVAVLQRLEIGLRRDRERARSVTGPASIAIQTLVS